MRRWRASAIVLAACALACPLQAWSWSGHALCTRPALAGMPELARPPVRAESLEHFVHAEAPGLAVLLRDHEAWARANIPNYPARPDTLAFKAQPVAGDAAAVPRFLQALRMNGQSRLRLFVQRMPGAKRDGQVPLPLAEVTTLDRRSSDADNPFIPIAEGEAVEALDVVATASAEPDYGLDIGLFADNGTEQGQRYGFGKQPFGSPSVDYSSQAPFHMGFFHEAAIVDAAAGFLKRTHTESRIAQYTALARHAFATGHDYWGWRFTGWAAHYVQDLTQPYHARVLPGLSTLRMLWINTLDLAGFHGAKADAITLVTNRHIVLENYQLRRITAAHLRGDPADPLLVALRDGTSDGERSAFTPASARHVVSDEAADSADALDARLEATFPARYVADATQPLGNDADRLDMSQIAQAAPAAEREALDRDLARLLARYGRHTRAVVRAVLAPR